ncbi:hypothetical protein KY290_003482 [Solanum tuberosum]|uniref:Retrovirus-related Pol polyprotein from transposon TNT 1-94-like beta-barrel domain-containing protein n=1 Tax=Solanum tuberosum TaxID=4113 RepID=A0ABQ7WVA4_SOLTU|nr:hypothetical protein KY290_003482 [Solanum tuberosum]
MFFSTLTLPLDTWEINLPPYHPGLRILTDFSKGRVSQVTAGSIIIEWIEFAGNGPECSTVPATEQSPGVLKLLITKIRTALDIMWQDGTLQKDLDATSLMPIDVIGKQHFFLEQCIEENFFDDCDISRVGVVKSVNSKDLSWVGNITGFKNGYVEVPPDAILVLDPGDVNDMIAFQILMQFLSLSAETPLTEWMVDKAISYHATPIAGIKDICIKTNVGCTLILKDVCHVPDLRMNLISRVALDRDG